VNTLHVYAEALRSGERVEDRGTRYTERTREQLAGAKLAIIQGAQRG
jgi:hypothetical protein